MCCLAEGSKVILGRDSRKLDLAQEKRSGLRKKIIVSDLSFCTFRNPY